MAKVYYVGDWAVMTGPVFAETPFFHSPKGLDIFNYGVWLKDALESTGEHQVASVPSWDFYNRLGPGDYETILDEYDVFVFSDVDAKPFGRVDQHEPEAVAPGFFDRSKFGRKPLVFPDRLRLTMEAVKAGKGLMLLGGWYSFTGELGKGGWGRTRLKDLLPVRCLDVEDLVESTEGYWPGGRFSGGSIWPPCRPCWDTTRPSRSRRAASCSRSRRRAIRWWPYGSSARAASWPTPPIPPRTGAATSSTGTAIRPSG
jgi:hypothetical protein